MVHNERITKEIDVTRVKQRSPGSMPFSHFHDSHELYFLVSGSAKYFISGEIFQVEQGDIVLVPKGAIHKTAYIHDEYLERILISFNDSLIDSKVLAALFQGTLGKLLKCPEEHASEIRTIFEKIEREYQAPQSFSRQLLKAYITELLIVLYRLQLTPTAVTENPTDLLMQQAAQYINENFASPLTLSGLAKAFSMSESHFSRTFKRCTGFGVSYYINLVRVMHAKLLLSDSHLTVTEVASQCGFNDSNYFSTVFKKQQGISPKKFYLSKDFRHET